MNNLRIFLLLFVVVMAGMYFIYYKRGKNPLLLPGDIYRIRGERPFYFPIGAGLIITVLLYLVAKLIF